MVNKVILVGRLGKDPELRYTPQGTPVTVLWLATERRWRDAQGDEHRDTEWHTVVAWNKLAEACSEYLGKGSLVYIEGRLHWKDDPGAAHRRTEVIVEVVRFLERRPGTAAREA